MNCKTPPHFDHCKSSNKFTNAEDSVDVDIEENVVAVLDGMDFICMR